MFVLVLILHNNINSNLYSALVYKVLLQKSYEVDNSSLLGEAKQT